VAAPLAIDNYYVCATYFPVRVFRLLRRLYSPPEPELKTKEEMSIDCLFWNRDTFGYAQREEVLIELCDITVATRVETP